MCVSKRHAAQCKYVQFLFAIYTLIQLGNLISNVNKTQSFTPNLNVVTISLYELS